MEKATRKRFEKEIRLGGPSGAAEGRKKGDLGEEKSTEWAERKKEDHPDFDFYGRETNRSEFSVATSMVT